MYGMIKFFCVSAIIFTTTDALCYQQGPCEDGFVDKSQGSYKRWTGTDIDCAVCAGGPYYANDECDCACILMQETDECTTGSSQTYSDKIWSRTSVVITWSVFGTIVFVLLVVYTSRCIRKKKQVNSMIMPVYPVQHEFNLRVPGGIHDYRYKLTANVYIFLAFWCSGVLFFILMAAIGPGCFAFGIVSISYFVWIIREKCSNSSVVFDSNTHCIGVQSRRWPACKETWEKIFGNYESFVRARYFRKKNSIIVNGKELDELFMIELKFRQSANNMQTQLFQCFSVRVLTTDECEAVALAQKINEEMSKIHVNDGQTALDQEHQLQHS